MKDTKKTKQIRQAEYHLRNYKTYQTAVKNLKQEIDYIMPNMDVYFQLRDRSFTFSSSTDQQGSIDRMNAIRVLNLYEKMKRYQMTIHAIDTALDNLNDLERSYVVKRYFNDFSIDKLTFEIGYSERSIFNIRQQVMEKLLISLSGIFHDP